MKQITLLLLLIAGAYSFGQDKAYTINEVKKVAIYPDAISLLKIMNLSNVSHQIQQKIYMLI